MNSNMQLYSVKDIRAGHFLPPFVSTNHATAQRSFETAVREEGHDFHRYATDYALYYVGVFDNEAGELSSGPNFAGPEHLIDASAILRQIELPLEG